MGFGSRLQRVFGAPVFGRAELKGAFLDCYGLFLFDYEINGPKKEKSLIFQVTVQL